MVYVVGIIGFVVGFSFGQMLLFFILRGVPKEKMLKDKHLHLKYGLLNWLIAGLGCYAALALYGRYL